MITRVLRAALALVGVRDSGRCRCGHSRDVHEHYRPGTECALCATGSLGKAPLPQCARYRPTWRRA
jgi:hypothetical protein